MGEEKRGSREGEGRSDGRDGGRGATGAGDDDVDVDDVFGRTAKVIDYSATKFSPRKGS